VTAPLAQWSELDELYVSARHTEQWKVGGYKLENVATTVQEPLTSPPSAWRGRIILWGHDRSGPFSIIEGNHRILGYAGAKTRPPLNIDVYVGTSPSHCYWHFADPANLLANDLIKPNPKFGFTGGWLVVI